MPDDKFSACEKRLQGDATEILAMSAFINTAFKVYSQTGNILSYVSSDAPLRTLVLEFKDGPSVTDLNLAYQSLYVQSWSSFELFVRRVVVGYLEEFSTLKNDYVSLAKANLINRNYLYSGRALQQVFEDRSHMDIDFVTLSRNLATTYPDSKEIILNVASFALSLGNPSKRGIDEALRRIGFSEFDWNRLASNAAVQRAFGTKKAVETKKQLHDFLEASSRVRNAIVHRADNIPTVTEQDVTQVLAVFQALAQALIHFLRSECHKT
jgi:hypothetical protein